MDGNTLIVSLLEHVCLTLQYFCRSDILFFSPTIFVFLFYELPLKLNPFFPDLTLTLKQFLLQSLNLFLIVWTSTELFFYSILDEDFIDVVNDDEIDHIFRQLKLCQHCHSIILEALQDLSTCLIVKSVVAQIDID